MNDHEFEYFKAMIVKLQEKVDHLIGVQQMTQPRCRVCGQWYGAPQHQQQLPSNFPVEQIHQFVP